jgi:Transposase
MRVAVPPPVSNRRLSLCLAHKRHIVHESGLEGNIRSTARKYGVQPTQIRRWKASFEQAMVAAADFAARPGMERATISRVYRRLQSVNRHRFNAGGRPTLLTSEFLTRIKTVIQERRNANLSVSMQIVRRESRKIHPTLFDNIAETAFNHRMYRMMKKWELSYRRKTTVAKVSQY